jgi:hypothetical protein
MDMNTSLRSTLGYDSGGSSTFSDSGHGSIGIYINRPYVADMKGFRAAQPPWVRQAFEQQTPEGRELLSILAANAAQMCAGRFFRGGLTARDGDRFMI